MASNPSIAVKTLLRRIRHVLAIIVRIFKTEEGVNSVRIRETFAKT